LVAEVARPDALPVRADALNGFDIGPDGVDGYLSGDTAKAIINARIAYRLSHQDQALVDTDLERELSLLAIQDPAIVGIAKAKGIDLISLLKLIGLANRLLKGDTTMTSDQITGVIRALIAALSGFLIAKGIGTADFWTWIGAGVTAIVPVVWTWISNRPKTIVPISQK
jgi:hypothetical protein